MPPVLQGHTQGKNLPGGEFKDVDHEYTYTEIEGKELDLRPGSKLHTKIKNEVIQRAQASARIMANRHPAWNQIDKTLTTFINIDEQERNVKDSDPRKPVSIVFPYSYAVLETLLSYFVSAFLQDPIFRYEGVGPDDVIGAILLQEIVSLHTIRHKVGLAFHTQARDSFSYGFGVVTPTWRVHRGKRTSVKRGKGKFSGLFGRIMPGRDRVIVEDDAILFEGNALDNIDPYLYLPDTNVPIHEPQKGEYVGWIDKKNYVGLLTEEQSDDDMFNVRFLKQLKGRRTSIIHGDMSCRNKKSGQQDLARDGMTDSKTQPVDVIRMFIKIIPKDWELSSRETPELWLFSLGADEVIIQARPADLDHDMFPVGVIAPDYDGYSTSPLSRIEILNGLQGVLDFLFNSHIANVRKAINDMLIYDPYLVNTNDLANPEPGKLIRMRRPAWGRGVKDAVQQLQVNDITRANIADSAWITNAMDKISATDDAAKGALRQGGPERLTSAEFQGTAQGGLTRLERIAKVAGMQGIQDIGFFFGIHTQQFMTQDHFIKVAGDWQEVLMAEYGKGKVDRGRIAVHPQDLLINYNIIVRDGSVPGGNYSQIWVKMFDILGKNPQLSQHFDIVRIFKHIARNLGAKNVNEFVKKGGNIQADIQPDEVVRAEVQAGNLTPLG